jgi:DUF4097 and DUF4098 domain-containing protein YvlB
MLKPKIFLNIFALTVVWTVGFSMFALFSASRAQQQDPEIFQKIGRKIAKNNIHFSIDTDPHISGPRNYIPTEESWSFPISSEQIEIETLESDIEISSDPSKKMIEISAQGELDKSISPRLLQTVLQDRRLSIREPDDQATQNLHIKVILPGNFTGGFSVTTVSGPIRLKKIILPEAQVHSISGPVQIEFSKIKKLEVETISGLVVVDNIPEIAVDVKTVSGDVIVKLSNPKETSLEVETESGTVINPYGSAQRGKSTTRIRSVSGNIEIK